MELHSNSTAVNLCVSDRNARKALKLISILSHTGRKQLGPVARSVVDANHWLKSIETYTFLS